VLGLALGFWASKTEPPSIARWLTSISTLGLAMPTFFIGGLFFAFWFLYVLWGGPGTIPLPISGFGWDSHLIVPVLVLMVRPTVQIAQVTAGHLSEEFGMQYIVAARSRGKKWPVIRRRDAFRNILVPVVMTIAAAVRILVGELIVVEWLFNWPGLGNLLAKTLIPSGMVSTRGLTDSGLFLDPPVVAAVLTVFALLFIFTDLSASILVRVVDPRLRE
jgi:peptide/nickel transport system permease protein